MTARKEPTVTVCGLDPDAPPELLTALAALGRAAAEAFGEDATVVLENGPCGCEELQ